MRVTRVDFLVLTMCAIGSAVSPQISAAVAYVPHAVIEEQRNIYNHSQGIICLFHGANPDIVHQILGQEFSAFRTPAAEALSDKTPVGKVRLTEVIGAYYLEAMITEGEVKEGDIVQLLDIHALVVLTNGRCETLKQPDQGPEQ